MSGWIIDYKKELDSTIWQMPPMYHRVWQYIKYSAYHAPFEIPNADGTFTNINIGQFPTSYRQLAKGVGYYEGRKWKEPNPKTIKNILSWLGKQNMISVEGNTLGTIVTVEKWEYYQKEIVKGNTKVTLKKHLLDTNKEDIKKIKRKTSVKFLEESNEYRLSNYLYKYILKNNPDAKEPNLQSWSKDIDLMIRLDNRSVEGIKKVIEWSQNDEFWHSNILSTSKLRKQYDALCSKMNKIQGNQSDNSYKGLEVYK